ncbi:hypothetical protein MBBA_2477 [Methanoculleus bourgensis]|uniref:hypothetical protein n=1 Tax=Methanoculleus bourgensis TaxID=83986 RepID=UPI0007BCA9EA|nr:hypothetical protein MBBA_2477 [Methanoculleus bourgensis]
MVRSGVFLLLLALLIPAAAAATITITPASIDPGDTVTVDVQNLPDGAAFSFGIRGEFDVNPGDTFAFTARDLVLPFSLGSGEVSAYSRGTEWTGLSVQMPDGASASLSNSADANGEFRTTQNYNISSGTYSAITLDGRAAPATERVVTEVTMQGVKTGPDDGRISFAIDGITHGTATVTVYVDGREALSRAVTIGSSPGSGGSGSGNGGGTSAPAPGPATTTSADGKASLTGTDLEGAGLLGITLQGTVPTGWSVSGKAYAVTPEGREFSPAAVLSFRLPSVNATATLARYENGAWTPVPSKVEGDRITAPVSRSGSYVLLVATPAVEPTATATVTAASPTQTATQATSATTTPTAAPVAPLLPVAALAILMLLGWKRKV